MKSKWLKIGMMALVVTALAITAVAVSAQTTDTTTAQVPGRGGWDGWGGPENSLFSIVIDKLGITQADLVTALQGGKTIAALAEEKNVQLSVIVDAVVAARTENYAQAVTDGLLTQAQVDARLALLKADLDVWLNKDFSSVTGGFRGRGMGGMFDDGMMGRGMGGMMGRGGHGHGMGGMFDRGMGRGFLDADGDGVCDNCPQAQSTAEPTVVPNG